MGKPQALIARSGALVLGWARARDRPSIGRFNSKGGVVTGGGIPAVRRMRGRRGQMGWAAASRDLSERRTAGRWGTGG